MSIRSLARPLAVVAVFARVLALASVLAGSAGCAASSNGAGDAEASSEGALEETAPAASRRYAAIAGTWKALDPVPPAGADGIPSYTAYAFAPDGTFRASRAAARVTGTWQIYTTLPELPRIDLTWGTTGGMMRETYVLSMQCDLLVLDGVNALFQHDLALLPQVAEGAVCEDVTWSSLATCPPDIGACDHETHRCLQAS